jgi:hypothetical protein
MCGKAFHLGGRGLLLVAFTVGCSSRPAEPPPVDEEGAVREKFAELQLIIKDRNADRLWSLLDSRSQADAERAAKAIQSEYAKASPEEKPKQEEALGLAGAELAGLTGKGFLKTKRFQGKYHEVPESKIEKVAVEKDSATIYYLESDGDKEKLILVRQDGQWRVWLTMPKVSQP